MLRLIGLFALTCSFVGAVIAQPLPDGSIQGQATEGAIGITETVDQIMERDRGLSPFPARVMMRGPEHEAQGREFLPQNPLALPFSQWPPKAPINKDRNGGPHLPQTLGVSFLAGTSATSGFVPPDTMIAVGPTQILQCLNGRITVYSKTGTVGPLDTTTDNFFNAVRNGQGTADPRVKFDRFTNRWFVVMINTAPTNNSVLVAVSSGATITGAGSFTFFGFQFNTFGGGGAADNGLFFDYPTLGVDEDALYIGGSTFGAPQATCFVIQKSSVLGAGPIVGTAFRLVSNLNSLEGPYVPQGVSNDLIGTNEGYFVGVSAVAFSRIVVRRIANPGSLAPTMSPNVLLNVPTTVVPTTVATPLSGTPLDGIDDRLIEAFIRKNRYDNSISLWTCHQIEVDASGLGNSSGSRNGVRWYEIRNLSGAPTLQQAGTVFDASATPLSYWMSGINATGQGYMALAPNGANSTTRPNIYSMGRFYTDPVGQVQAPFSLVQSSGAFSYGPFSSPDRWGDYATVSVDPNDDQTMWAAQQYINSANSWGVRIFQLRAPAPSITSIAPNSLLQGATANVVVTGTGLYDTEAGYNRLAAAFSGTGITVNSVTLNSITQATVNVTISGSATTGARNLNVTNPDGQVAAANNILTITAPNNPVPTISSISPNSVVAGGGTIPVLILGSNFTPDSVAQVNGSARATTYFNSGSIQMITQSGEVTNAGTYSITVFNPAPGGGTSNAATFTALNPVPILGSITPTSVTAGSAGFTLICTGSGFASGSVIRWNGTPRTTSFFSSTELRTSVSAAEIANAGTVNISVFNAAPGGGTSANITLTINNPVPTLTTLSPSSATAGGAGFTLTCTGTNFNSQSVIRWNGTDRPTTLVNSTTLTASISAAEIATAGTFSVTVFNPAPGGGTTAAQNFTVNNPAPTLSAIAPNSATAGGAGFTLTCSGTNFNSQSVVRWNGSARTTTFVNSTTLTASISAADIATAGTFPVTIFNPTPGGGTSAAQNFTVNNPTPVLSGLSPSVVFVGGSSFTLTVTGANFNSQSIVRLGGISRATTFVNSTTLTANILASDISTSGLRQITVFNPLPGGGTSGPQSLLVTFPVPVITSISPAATGVAAPGFTLTVNGSSFYPSSVVRWNGSPLTTTYVSPAQLTASVPAGLLTGSGSFPITVLNPTPGGGPSGALSFTVNPRTFSGTVNLVAYSDPTGVPITLRFRPLGGAPGSEVLTTTVNLSPTSTFTLNTNLPPGNYDIYADGTIWLQRRLSNVNATGLNITGLTWNLPAGDIDGDGAITPSDYGIWAANNGSFVTPGEFGDLDGDGAVTPSDYGIWAENNGLFDDD